MVKIAIRMQEAESNMEYCKKLKCNLTDSARKKLAAEGWMQRNDAVIKGDTFCMFSRPITKL